MEMSTSPRRSELDKSRLSPPWLPSDKRLLLVRPITFSFLATRNLLLLFSELAAQANVQAAQLQAAAV